MRRIWTGGLLALLVPYVVTLALSGSIKGEQKQAVFISGRQVVLDSGQKLDVEEYLVGVVARQIPADYGAEALKAQAVIARTYIYKQMGEATEISETELRMEYLEERQMMELWGSDRFAEHMQSIRQAVEGVGGLVLSYEDELINPLFHRASAGRTRDGDSYHPYLEGVDSSGDVEAEGFITMTTWGMEQFANVVNGIRESTDVSAGQLPDSVQLIEREDSGYVKAIQIGNHTFTGEEVQAAMGLPSACFTLEGYEGGMRAVCRGIGHGYGLSQYGARIMAEQGATCEDILNYYFKNIRLISVFG